MGIMDVPRKGKIEAKSEIGPKALPEKPLGEGGTLERQSQPPEVPGPAAPAAVGAVVAAASSKVVVREDKKIRVAGMSLRFKAGQVLDPNLYDNQMFREICGLVHVDPLKE
jgi:hypothetical protein